MVCIYLHPVVSVLVSNNVGLRNPAGVTVDEGGFVYVCRYWSQNVVIITILLFTTCNIFFC